MKRLALLLLLLLLAAPRALCEEEPTYVFPFEGFRFTAAEGERVLTQDNLSEYAELLAGLGTSPEVMLSSFAANQTVMEVLPEGGGQYALRVAGAGAFADYGSAAQMDEEARAAFRASFADSGMYQNVAWSENLPDYLTMTSSALQGDAQVYTLSYVTLRHGQLYLMSATIIGRTPGAQDAQALEELLSRVTFLGRLATPEPTPSPTPEPTPSPTPRPTPGSAQLTASQEGLTLIVADMPAWTDEEDLTVTGTTMAGATVRLMYAGERIARATADQRGAFSLTATLPEEGDLSLTVEASLTGQATASQTYALRFERRDAQISVTEPEGGVVQQTKFYMRGVTEPNATVYVKGEGVSTNVKANARGVFSVPMNMEKEGTFTYELTVKADGLNEGGTTYTITRQFSERERLAEFRGSLSATSYDALLADPAAHAGERLSFRVRIAAFGDVEGAAGMLVYTADIGRDVMTDPVWVFSDEILSFGEGDVLTIYVTVEGTSVDYDGQLLPAVRLWFYNE